MPAPMFPIFLCVEGRPCLVVGGGSVAARKIQRLLAAGAEVRVVARQLCPELERLCTEGRLHHLGEGFCERHLASVALVICATDDVELNRSISVQARARSLPVNVVDQPELCTFTTPALVERLPLQIAVGTGGAAPMLARRLRTWLEASVPAGYGSMANLMGRFRASVQRKFADARGRRRFWERVLDGPILELMLSGRPERAAELLQAALEQDVPPVLGEVYLVGGGPGDPDLLTLRALRLMQQADVVIYDRLIASSIVDLARRDAERIYVGKERDCHTVPQQEINQHMVKLARAGQRVLRLKGGDPFIFGRGGEEIDSLAEQRIPFQIVPGITAASGCSCYAGIPLTHRDYAHSCVFVTGHLKDGRIDLNWQALVQPRQTIAVYMGVQALEVLCDSLIEHGMPTSTPVALIERGTTSRQRVHVGALRDLPGLGRRRQVRAPAIIIIGEVVKLRQSLSWFQPGPVESVDEGL